MRRMTADYPLEISVHEAQQLSSATPPAATIIDVREPDELEICHVAGAQAIPMREIPVRLATLPRDRHWLILCHSGGRSRRVTEFLRAQGFPAVSNIAGGIDAWARELEPGMARY